MTPEEHAQGLYALMVRDHEDDIAEAERLADEAEAEGKRDWAEFHRRRAAELRATPVPNPWEERKRCDGSCAA